MFGQLDIWVAAHILGFTEQAEQDIVGRFVFRVIFETGSFEILDFMDLSVSGRGRGIFFLEYRAYRQTLLFETAVSLPVRKKATTD